MLLNPAGGQSADAPAAAIEMTRQASGPAVAQLLTLDDALLIALDNHPNIKAARERVAAQRAVLGQQMAAYYPSLSITDRYQTGTQAGSSAVAPFASEFYSGQVTTSLI